MRVTILGTGGHAHMLAWLGRWGDATVTMTEDNSDVLPDDSVVIGVGDLGTRVRLYDRFPNQVIGLVAHDVYLASSPSRHATILERSAQVCLAVKVLNGVTINANVLINTGAQIDHGCVIGPHTVIGPGAILCGGVTLGARCHIGAGAIVLENVTLNADTFIPAGSLVVGPEDLRRPVRILPNGIIPHKHGS